MISIFSMENWYNCQPHSPELLNSVRALNNKKDCENCFPHRCKKNDPFLCNVTDNMDELIELTLKVSIGAAIYPGDGETADILFKKADQAMYQAKGTEKRVMLFSESASG